MKLLVNVVAFKIGWLSAVFGSANGMPQLGALVIFVAVVIHLMLASQPRIEVALLAIAGAIGFAWDSMLVSAGWMSYPTGNLVPGLAPYWILSMWLLFATTLNVAFQWLQPKLMLASVLGAVTGPLSFYAGMKAGAVTFIEPRSALIALSIGWALLFPGLLYVARRLHDGTTAAKAAI